MEVIVDRSHWLRGHGETAMLDAHGHRCVHGFLLAAFGIADHLICNRYAPYEVQSPMLPAFLQHTYTDSVLPLWATIAEVNDDIQYTDAERECYLAGLLAPEGVVLRFVDTTDDESGGCDAAPPGHGARVATPPSDLRVTGP